jgi:hypothetical protein
MRILIYFCHNTSVSDRVHSIARLMSTPAQRTSVLRLYRQLLKAASQFKTYSFREYFTRRTHESFRDLKLSKKATPAASTPQIEAFLANGAADLAMLRRQATVNQLFATGDSIIHQLPQQPGQSTVHQQKPAL